MSWCKRLNNHLDYRTHSLTPKFAHATPSKHCSCLCQPARQVLGASDRRSEERKLFLLGRFIPPMYLLTWGFLEIPQLTATAWAHWDPFCKLACAPSKWWNTHSFTTAGACVVCISESLNLGWYAAGIWWRWHVQLGMLSQISTMKIVSRVIRETVVDLYCIVGT